MIGMLQIRGLAASGLLKYLHLISNPCRKFPPITKESSGVTTACGQPLGKSKVSPGPSSYRTHPSACSAKKLVACSSSNLLPHHILQGRSRALVNIAWRFRASAPYKAYLMTGLNITELRSQIHVQCALDLPNECLSTTLEIPKSNGKTS